MVTTASSSAAVVIVTQLAATTTGDETEGRMKRSPTREARIRDEIIVDAHEGSEQAIRHCLDRGRSTGTRAIPHLPEPPRVHPAGTRLGMTFSYRAGVILTFRNSSAVWSPCRRIGPGAPSFASIAPPVGPGMI